MGAGAPTEAKWNEFLSKTGLDAYRGRVAERNALDAPWIHTLDFHYDFEIPITAVKAQITFDVLNLINLIDSNSGLMRYVNNQTYTAAHLLGNGRGHGQADVHRQLRRARRGHGSTPPTTSARAGRSSSARA